MRMSCNGCRVLRKGCSDNCSIRPCLQWIKNPESQANATVFLAKFYGRAGLLNLLNAGPDHLRPAIFRSLLYEACGRIVNPIYGSVGLLWSQNWHMCQAAVEAVLKGAPIVQLSTESAAASAPSSGLKPYDIRHVSNNKHAESELHKVAKTRTRFKRSGAAAKPSASPHAAEPADSSRPDFLRAPSHESSASHGSEPARNDTDRQSVDTVEAASHVSQAEPSPAADSRAEPDEMEEDVGLELTLGFEPVSRAARPGTRCSYRNLDTWDLGLELPA
ncbi:LOB domain-containing protein 41-like [Typha latifolia]|uniref:LOB domain-containing protein 41-like n=1 Tax=Typha latifolia TaxID=4733 RepID=UPI003C2B5876